MSPPLWRGLSAFLALVLSVFIGIDHLVSSVLALFVFVGIDLSAFIGVEFVRLYWC